MAQASIPVDLYNPGQVFACMGFLEAADVLLGPGEGGFDWDKGTQPCFELLADGANRNAFEEVLEFLVHAQLYRLAPKGYTEPPRTAKRKKKGEARDPTAEVPLMVLPTFPARSADRLALPLRFERDGRRLDMTHWCDGSSRNSFKLFAGQQNSVGIGLQMLQAIKDLWAARREELVADPLGLSVPLGGSSFKLDARKSWTAIDAGYSPDEQDHEVVASPVVELLGGLGLEHARPDEFEKRQVRYGVWKGLLPPVLARAALAGIFVAVPLRVFRFTLDRSGQNKVVTFAQEEVSV